VGAPGLGAARQARHRRRLRPALFALPALPLPLRLHRDFRRLWGAQVLSALGDGVALVALPLYLVQSGRGGGAIGIVLGVQVGCLVAFLLLGGVWADRLPRERVLVASDLARLVLHGLLGGLIIAGHVPLGAIIAIEALFGVAEAFFRPTLTGLTPQTVPEADIQAAAALMQLPGTALRLAGPALATTLVLTLGAGAAFLLDAATFAASAALVVRIRPRARGDAPAERQSTLRELRDGWREFRARSWVWVTVAVFSVGLVLTAAPFDVLAPLVARDRFGGVEYYGYIAIAGGFGTLVGSLAGLRWRPARPLRTAFLVAYPWPVALALLAAGASFPVVLALFFLAEGGLALFIVWWETSLATYIPPGALSRVSSYDWLGSTVLLPLGFPLMGVLGEALGVREVMGVSAVIAIGVFSLGLIPRETRELR
jgi:MFS family permease